MASATVTSLSNAFVPNIAVTEDDIVKEKALMNEALVHPQAPAISV
jgi:hypothetical protein